MTAHARRSDALPTRSPRVSHSQLGVVAYPLAAIAIILTLCCALPVATIAGCIIANQKLVLFLGQICTFLEAIPQQIWWSACAVIGAIIDDELPAFPAWMRTTWKKLGVSVRNLVTAFANTVDMFGQNEQILSLQTSPEGRREGNAHNNDDPNAGPVTVSRSNDHSTESSNNHSTDITSSHSPNTEDTEDTLEGCCSIWKAACDIAINQGRRLMTDIPPAPLGICDNCAASKTGGAANKSFESCYHSMSGVYIIISFLDAQEEQNAERDTQAAHKARETARYRALLKQEMLRWHPDKFCALPDEHREHVQAQAKELFQIAQKLLEKEMKPEKTLAEELMLCLEAMWLWLEQNWRTVILIVAVFVTVEVLQRFGYI